MELSYFNNELTETRYNRKRKKVPFEFPALEATKVILAGDFNAWKEDEIQMNKEKDGVWKIKVALESGRYEYKFIVDNQWRSDPDNIDYVQNEHGSKNSVLRVVV